MSLETDLLVDRRILRRKLTVWRVLAFLFLAAALIVAGARVEDARVAMIFLALAAGLHLFGQTSSWAAAIDMSPSHPATLFGLMNTTAQTAGAVAPVMTPFLAQTIGWTHALDFAAGMALLTGILWLWVRPDRPLPENDIEGDTSGLPAARSSKVQAT